MATESPAAQLIAVEIEYPEFATLINDIRDFDWKIINKLRKEDLARVASTGFRFNTKGKVSQQKELASFLIEHPSVMASDFEMIINKLQIYARLIGQQPKQTTRPAIKHEKQKPKKKKIIVVEEEEDIYTPSASDSEEDSEEDVRENQRRKDGKPALWY